ncbi:hypothetical protein J6590_070702 [Homalodisca vitripennis]|nr:hypothetical protein J6590_070702 [Homalodisca vitripennis]
MFNGFFPVVTLSNLTNGVAPIKQIIFNNNSKNTVRLEPWHLGLGVLRTSIIRTYPSP